MKNVGTPAHTGIQGNEEADTLEKKVTSKSHKLKNQNIMATYLILHLYNSSIVTWTVLFLEDTISSWENR